MNRFDVNNTIQSIYIHWPFCPYKCHFCPFVALAGQDEHMKEYHDALQSEIQYYASRLQDRAEIGTIYFGGGTPSTYPVPLLSETMRLLHDAFIISERAEITLEVNPGTAEQVHVLAWKNLGINRLSIGVQSLKDRILHKLNRLQTAEQVHRLLNYTQGICNNVSVDVIIGMPDVTSDEWKSMMHEIIGWPIMHLSLYFLTVHQNTPLYFGIKKEAIVLPPEDEIVDLYHWTVHLLQSAGFEQYEISNFARNGKYSEHNKAYWDRKPYFAFGLGACSFDGKRRFQNEKNLKKYMNRAMIEGQATCFSEELTAEQERLEISMLSLRQKRGISLDVLYSICSVQKQKELPTIIAQLIKTGLLIQENNHIRLTPAGLAVQNSIVIALSE